MFACLADQLLGFLAGRTRLPRAQVYFSLFECRFELIAQQSQTMSPLDHFAQVLARFVEVSGPTVNPSDRQGSPLNYRWTASAGQLQEAGPSARWNPAGLSAGAYVLTARVDDGLGHSATCSFHLTVQ